MGKPHDGFNLDHAKPFAFAVWIGSAIGPAGLSMIGAELGLWSDLHEWPTWLNVALVIWTIGALAAHRPAIDCIGRLINRTNRPNC
jgi:hypothetical protein